MKPIRFAAPTLPTLLLAVLTCVMPREAHSDPDWATATVAVEAFAGSGSVIYLVGQSEGVVDPMGEFQVLVSASGSPYGGVKVTIDFRSCADLWVAPCQPFPGMTVETPGTVSGFTNSSGVATFRIVGNALNTGCTAGCVNGAGIFLMSTPLMNVKVAAFDQEGSGVGANDLSRWLTDFGCGQYFMRSDYDGDGSVGATDLSLWLTCFGGGGSVDGGADVCVE